MHSLKRDFLGEYNEVLSQGKIPISMIENICYLLQNDVVNNMQNIEQKSVNSTAFLVSKYSFY